MIVYTIVYTLYVDVDGGRGRGRGQWEPAWNTVGTPWESIGYPHGYPYGLHVFPVTHKAKNFTDRLF